ncbi:MAG: hypothetical protein OXH79_07510 [Boseongicola sp.]|nr:hypothetical protein [Boseongicola sp.]
MTFWVPLSRAVGIDDPWQSEVVGLHKLAPADTGGLPERIGKACAGAAALPGQPVVVARKRLQRNCSLIDLRARDVAVMGEAKSRDKVILRSIRLAAAWRA